MSKHRIVCLPCDGIGKVVLEEHLEHCIVEAIRENDQKEPLDKFKDALSKFIR